MPFIQEINNNASPFHPQQENNFIDIDCLELQVKQIIRKFDFTDRMDYDLAMEMAPDIVATESPIKIFLETEKYDPHKAAIRLCTYWKTRRNLFGDRWVLPMNQTGRGALHLQDIEILRSGFVVVIPRPNKGLVILLDESRLPRDPGASLLRILFYYKVLNSGDNPKAGTFVHIVTSAHRHRISMDTEPHQIFSKVLATRTMPKLVVAQAYEENKKHLVEFNAYRVKRTEEFRSQRHVVHIAGNSVNETALQLQSCGIERQYFPPCLGGQFDYTFFDRWVKKRLSIEGAMSAAPPTLQSNVFTHEKWLQTKPRPTEGRAANSVNKTDARRARRATVERQRYQRQKSTIDILQKERFSLHRRNDELRADNTRLELALKQAQSVLSVYLNVSSPLCADNIDA